MINVCWWSRGTRGSPRLHIFVVAHKHDRPEGLTNTALESL
jgi:hypothetical protein